jgi:hypothetical protein
MIPGSLTAWQQFVVNGANKYSKIFPEITKNVFWKQIQPKLTGFAKVALSKIPVTV